MEEFTSGLKDLQMQNEERVAYFLGVIVSDGCASKEKRPESSSTPYQYVVSLQVTDKEFRDKFAKTLKRLGLNPCKYEHDNKRESNKPIHHVQATSVDLVRWYKSLEYEDMFPLVTKSDETAYKFIEGAFEGDGHASKGVNNTNTQYWKITTSESELKNLYKKILGYLDYNPNIVRVEHDSYNTVEVFNVKLTSQKPIKKMLDRIEPCMERKKGEFNYPVGRASKSK